MKVRFISNTTGKKLVGGTLPDIDTDFEGKSRGRVKAYMEERFGKAQVCSVGSVSTLKLKGLLKDFDRQLDNDFSRANLMTAIISDKDITMLDLFKTSANEPRLKQYIKENSDVFHMMPTLLNQPKTNSIHPCAMIIFPDVMGASEWCPVRKQKGLIVSEWDGYQMEDAGFLKEDVLSLNQLDKFSETLTLIERNKKEVPDVYNLPNDSEVFRYFGNGWNGDVFQFESDGMITFTKSLKPRQVEDLIAANALFRPGPMENHFHEIYSKCKNEGRAPDHLWGTEEITKDTFGLLVYQEQIMQVCQQIGGLTMQEADDVRRAMGKKKLDVLTAWKPRVQKGFLKKGCPVVEFEKTWDVMIEFAKYSFNKSHSAAYALTAYASMFLKVNFPLENWTTSLGKANNKSILNYLSEIAQAKNIEILPPNINSSEIEMNSDMESQNIYWGLGSIKGIGDDTAFQVINDRKENGKYHNLTEFIERHTFKGSKVKKQTFEALISAGAFDGLYRIKNGKKDRFSLVNRFRIFKSVKVANKKRDPYTVGSTDKNWWWLLKQKELTGLAFVDYRKLAEDHGIETDFCTLQDLSGQQKGIFRSFGGYVVECKIGKSKRGKYARIQIEHNYKMHKLIIWSEEYARFEEILKNCEKSFIVFSANLKYEAKWTKGNQFTLTENSILKVLK